MRPGPMTNFPQRGEIWLIQFVPEVGSEQGGTRPGLILQNNLGNEFANTTIVAAMTTNLREMPVHVFLDKKDGVEKPCMIMLEQIHTIDKKRLVKKLGKIREDKFKNIFDALCSSLGFD
jgi:mRNA interferase MazF